MTDFKIGDRIEIIDSGNCYSTYTELAGKLNATNFIYNKKCKNGETGIIKNIDYSTFEIALVELGDYEFLINVEGIKK